MCNFCKKVKDYKLVILFIGSVLIFLSALLYILNSQFSFLTLAIGIFIFIGSIVLFFYERFASENKWQYLSYYVLILSLLLWVVIATTEIKSSIIQEFENIYITIDIAILSVTFAVLAIKTDQIIDLLKKSKTPTSNEIQRFQAFIVVTAFMILFSIFVSIFSILPNITPLFQDHQYGINIYIPSFLFGMTTSITIILIFVMMEYISIIFEKIVSQSKSRAQ